MKHSLMTAVIIVFLGAAVSAVVLTRGRIVDAVNPGLAKARSFAAADALTVVRNDLADISNWETEASDPNHDEYMAYLRGLPPAAPQKKYLAFLTKEEADAKAASLRLEADKEKAAQAILSLHESDPGRRYLVWAWGAGSLDEQCLLAADEAVLGRSPGADGSASAFLDCDSRHGGQ